MAGAVSHLLGGAVILAIAASSAQGLPARSFERAELFASCAGRMAALAAHRTGFGETGAEATQDLAETFELMLDATLPAALAEGVPEDMPVKWRSRGWNETAALLAQTHFSFESRPARAAAEMLERRLADCTALVLPTGFDPRHPVPTVVPTR